MTDPQTDRQTQSQTDARVALINSTHLQPASFNQRWVTKFCQLLKCFNIKNNHLISVKVACPMPITLSINY